MGYSFRLAARVLLYAPSHRQDSTYHGLCYTSRGAVAGTKNRSMGPPWRIDPTTHRTMNERSYHGLAQSRLQHSNGLSQSLLNFSCTKITRAGRSSEVERSLMVRWVVGSILHGVLHDWCNKGRGMCYPGCGMVHIKEPLLLIDRCSLCGGSRFPFSLSEWSLTICPMPYNRR